MATSDPQQQERFQEETGLNDAPFLPRQIGSYLFLMGTHQGALEPVTTMLQNAYIEEGQIPRSLSDILREDVYEWNRLCWRICCDIMNGKDAPEPLTMTNPQKLEFPREEDPMSRALVQTMWDDGFIACFYEEPRFNVPWALTLMVYILLYAKVESKTTVAMFRESFESFSYVFSTETVRKLNTWSEEKHTMPSECVKRLCVFMLEDSLRDTVEKFRRSL